MNPPGEPTPIWVDGWPYYPRTSQPAALQPSLPSATMRTPPLVGAGILGMALILAVGATVATVAIVHHQTNEPRMSQAMALPTTSSSSTDDKTQVEATIRRALQITSTADPAYPVLFCDAFREKYADLQRIDTEVLHPRVQQVDYIDVAGNSATARVTAEVFGRTVYTGYDLRKEHGQWKMCSFLN